MSGQTYIDLHAALDDLVSEVRTWLRNDDHDIELLLTLATRVSSLHVMTREVPANAPVDTVADPTLVRIAAFLELEPATLLRHLHEWEGSELVRRRPAFPDTPDPHPEDQHS